LSSGSRGFMISICVEFSWTYLGGWEDVLFVALLTFCRCCSLIWLIVVEICMGLTQSCYVMEGFGMILLPLLRLLYDTWPVATIHRLTAWLCQWILASTLAYNTGGQQVDRDRPVDRRSSAGRARLILHWIDKITKKNTFNQYQYSRKYIRFSINWLVT